MKKFLSVFLVLLMILMLVSCSQDTEKKEEKNEESTTAEAKQEDEKTAENSEEGEILIGYVGALSGETALWGQAGLNGMKMAEADINEGGGILGRKVRVVEYDGKGDPLDSVNALNKLIDQDKVIAVVGTNFSSCNIPMAPIADQKKIPLIATAASSPEVTVDSEGNLHPYSFRIGFTDPFQGRVMASYVVNVLKMKKAAILINNSDPYSVGIAEYLKAEFSKLNGEMVGEEKAASGDQDFRAQLTKIKDTEPEVIFIPWIYKDVALITKQARELGIEAVFFGADGWDSQDLPELAGDAVNGGYYVSRTGFNTPKAKEFAKRYEEQFKITAEAECLFGYDGVMWIKQAIEAKNSSEPSAIRDGLEETKEFKGVLGDMSVDPTTHDPVRDGAIFQIKDGKIEFVEVYTP